MARGERAVGGGSDPQPHFLEFGTDLVSFPPLCCSSCVLRSLSSAVEDAERGGWRVGIGVQVAEVPGEPGSEELCRSPPRETNSRL